MHFGPTKKRTWQVLRCKEWKITERQYEIWRSEQCKNPGVCRCEICVEGETSGIVIGQTKPLKFTPPGGGQPQLFDGVVVARGQVGRTGKNWKFQNSGGLWVHCAVGTEKHTVFIKTCDVGEPYGDLDKWWKSRKSAPSQENCQTEAEKLPFGSESDAASDAETLPSSP